MKALLVLAVSAVAGLTAAPALAFPHAQQDRLIKSLRKQVAALQTRLNDFDACTQRIAGISRYGDETTTTSGAPFGYVWDDDGAGPAVPYHTSGLDFDGSPQSHVFVLLVDPTCVRFGRSAPSARFTVSEKRASGQPAYLARLR